MRKPCRPHVSRPSTFFARSLLSAFSPAPDEQTAEMIKEKRRRSRSWSVSNLRKRAAIIRLREKGKNEKGKKIRSTTLRRRPGALRACLSLSLFPLDRYSPNRGDVQPSTDFFKRLCRSCRILIVAHEVERQRWRWLLVGSGGGGDGGGGPHHRWRTTIHTFPAYTPAASSS